MLEIPPSSLRRYVHQFAAQLSPEAQAQRGRRFSARDVAMLQQARELLAQGRSPEEAAPLLQVIAEGEVRQPAEVLALVPSIAQALAQALDAAAGLRADIGGLADQQAAQARQLQALQEWARSSWYRRLFGSPPEEGQA